MHPACLPACLPGLNRQQRLRLRTLRRFHFPHRRHLLLPATLPAGVGFVPPGRVLLIAVPVPVGEVEVAGATTSIEPARGDLHQVNAGDLAFVPYVAMPRRSRRCADVRARRPIRCRACSPPGPGDRAVHGMLEPTGN